MPTAIAGFFTSGGIGATPGYSVFITPWMGHKAITGSESRTQSSSYLGGGELLITPALNNEVFWDIWLERGTYKYIHIYRTGADMAIHSIRLNAVEKAAIDAYNASGANNVVSTTTSIVVASAGAYVFSVKAASKNASSSNYYMTINSMAWIRTGD